jgi:hypothetical protein
MRRDVGMALLAGFAVACALAVVASSPAAMPVAKADTRSVLEPAPVLELALENASCEDFGFFAADKKKDCDNSCHKGKKCQKKQVCGSGDCPPPGYCWKCG